MAHVSLKRSTGKYQFLVDGMDLTNHTLIEGFRIELEDSDGANLPAKVHCTIWADTLDVELPDAVVEAMRAIAPESAA